MNTPLWPPGAPPAPWRSLQEMVAQGIVPSTGQLLALLQQVGAVATATMIQTGQGLTGGPLPESAEIRLADIPPKYVLANMGDITAPPVPTPADNLGWVRSEREVQAGTGLEGGGDLSANRTIALRTVDPVGTGPRPTVDAYGRVTELAALRETDIIATLGVLPPAQFSTIDALRAFNGPALAGTLVGRTSPSDGGGGHFAVKAGDTTTTDDGSMVIIDALGRRWWRVWSGTVNVNWFGAPGGDASDDAPRIQAALNAAAVLGRESTVLMPAGVYRFNTKLQITQSFASLKGVGRSTWIKAYFDDDDIVGVGDGTNLIDSFKIEDMRIDGAVPRTSGAGVRVRNGYNCLLKGLLFADQHHSCIDLDGGASQFLYSVEDCLLAGGTYGVRVGNQGGLVQDAYLIRTTIGSQTAVGLKLVHCSGFYSEQVSILSCGTAVSIAPGDDQYVTAAFFEKTLGDGCALNGWLIECAHANSSITDIKLDTCWGSSNGLEGIFPIQMSGLRIGGNGLGVISGIAIDTSEFANNQGSGIAYLGGAEVTFSNVHCMCNSQEGSALHHGLSVGSGVSDFTVIGGVYGRGGRISVVASNLQGYGIVVNGGASNRYRITDAIVTGNVIAGISDGGAGADRKVRGNVGYVNDVEMMIAGGMTTDANGDITVTLSPPMSATPTHGWAQLNGSAAPYHLQPLFGSATPTTMKVRFYDMAGVPVASTFITSSFALRAIA